MANRNALDQNAVASGTRIVPVDVSAADVTFGDVRPKGLYVVGAGNLAIVNEDATTATVAVPANFILPVGVYELLNAGTTATGIFAIY